MENYNDSEGYSNVKIELFPLHEKERAASPESFLLSLEEAMAIMKARKITWPIYNKYLHLSDEELGKAEIQMGIKNEILSEFNKEHINSKNILSICEKVKNGRYWTYYVTRITKANGKPERHIYSIESNVQGIGGNDIITPETYPAFYNEGQTVGEKAKIIGIPTDVRYIPDSEFHSIQNLYIIVSDSPTDRATIEFPKLQTISPNQHTIPNNALMNMLSGTTGKQPINAGAFDLTVIPGKKKQKEITVYVMATYEPEKGIVSNLTEYERDVSDAIMSIWEQAIKEGKPAAFTTDSLYRAMPGRGKRASPQQKGAITKATEKFLHLWLDVDATDELRKRGVIGTGDTYHVKDYYLRAQEHIYKATGGQSVRAWLIRGEPLILSYAKLTGQLLTVPATYLSIEKVKQGKTSGELVTMNESRQAMTSYMLRRIAVMKHDLKRAKEKMRSYNRRRAKDKTLEELPLTDFREQSDTILFSTLFKVTGTESSNRELTRRNREFCFDVLDYWKTVGYIKDYSQQLKGRIITGIIIEN